MHSMTEAPPDAEYRTLKWRFHSIRPGAHEGIAFVEACIEEQLSRLLDENPLDEALALLAEWNPSLDAESVVALLDVADALALADMRGDSGFYALVDEHAWALRCLAVRARSAFAAGAA